ncbi:chemotaxis protein CheW [Pseudoxanthomonas sp. PXM02]|uniref:chemotaxis protein CheW n=1 Tax=Pseudoxanthomonas sp. PXM02 TaxID=2769294 RepID=UPI0017870BBE|nr:chemotaxis protein CheW [Pseudoxanthomonas sp. PXM02]MBD9481083.1 purine-binding chemotaxis protein CheW [Pseudoxanthomonas sp. PXM02]
MTTPAVLDDYLQDLLGDIAAPPVQAAEPAATVVPVPEPAPVVAPTLAVAPVRAGSEADLITDDEFEALLDTLHGDAVPGAVATADTAPAPAPAPALAVAPVRAGSEADLITDDEFEALLDTLHGDAAPSAVASAAPAVPATPALAVSPVRPGADVIDDDEFEALLDNLHGGAAPTSRVVATPAPVPAAKPPVQAAPLPYAAVPLPAKPYLQAALDTGERRRATERKTRWLRLRCDQQHYALELLKVQEVVRPATLLPLRGAAPHMLGVMNLRGQVVPVIDLGLYLGRRAIETDATTRIVVLEEHGETLGLRVTAVEDVANLTDQQIESPDNARVGRIANPLFRGVARLNDCAVILLDASRILQ